jgi:plasmid stabilization system protein ParE
MKLDVVFRPEAAADVTSARRWYENQQAGLGRRFTRSLSEIIIRIQDMPQMYVVALETVRRAKLRTFPYLVYYRALEDRIEVLGVLHGSRQPSVWQERIS